MQHRYIASLDDIQAERQMIGAQGPFLIPWLHFVVLFFVVASPAVSTEERLVNTWRAESAAVSESRVWSTGPVGTVRLNKDGSIEFHQEDVGSLFQDAQGHVWQESATGIRKWEDGKFSEYELQIPSGETITEVTSFLGSQSGTVWVAGSRLSAGDALLGSTVVQIDDEGVHIFDLASAIGKCRVDVILEDSDGRVWLVGSEFKYLGDEDIFAIQIDGSEITTWQKSDGLQTTGSISTTVKAVLTTEGTLWISGYRGLSSFNGTKWNTITRVPGIGQTLSSVDKSMAAGPDGTLYLSTYTTLYIVREGVWSEMESTTSDGKNAIITGILPLEGYGVLVGTRYGLRIIQGDTLAFISGLPEDADESFIFSLAPTLHGAVVGTERGALVLEGGTWTIHRRSNEPAHLSVVDVEFGEDGSVWLAHGQFLNLTFGVSRYFNGAWTVYDAFSGLPGSKVNTIYSDGSGTIWTAGEGGVGRFEQGQWSSLRPSVPPCRRLQATDVCIDQQRRIWVSVSAEAFVEVRSEGDSVFRDTTWLLSFVDDRWLLFDEESVGEVSMLRASPDGTVWGASQFSGTLLHIAGDEFTRIVLEDTFDEATDQYPREVNDIAVDNAGAVYICYATQHATPERNPGGISIYRNGEWEHIERSQIDEFYELGSIALGPNGEVATINYHIGAGVYWTTGNGWNSREYLLGRFPQLSSVAIHRDGHILVGSVNAGAILYKSLISSVPTAAKTPLMSRGMLSYPSPVQVGDTLTLTMQLIDHPMLSVTLVGLDGMSWKPDLVEQTTDGVVFPASVVSQRFLMNGCNDPRTLTG